MRISLLRALARAGPAFSVADVVRLGNVSREVAWVILSRLEQRGWIERLAKGKYLVIPLDSEKGAYTLHEFVIASLVVQPAVIAYWSALNFHGLTEQIPSTVFVQTTARRQKRSSEIFGLRYRFIRIKEAKLFGIRSEWIDDLQVKITNREKTIVDCLDHPQHAGGVIEVAKALNGASLDRTRIASYANRIGNSGVIRRLGYLSERLGLDLPLVPPVTRNYLYLDPTLPHRGSRIAKWRLVDNLGDGWQGVLE